MHKILGYLFICIGVLLILFSLLCMYKVFVDRQPVAPVVQLTDVNLNTQYGPLSMPMQNVNTLANLGLFALLMMFVLSAGSKLAGVGTNLLKNERIHEALSSHRADYNSRPDETGLRRL